MSCDASCKLPHERIDQSPAQAGLFLSFGRSAFTVVGDRELQLIRGESYGRNLDGAAALGRLGILERIRDQLVDDEAGRYRDLRPQSHGLDLHADVRCAWVGYACPCGERA